VGCLRYVCITGCLFLISVQTSPRRAFGKVVFRTRLLSLLWLVAQGKILTIDNLRRRRIWVQGRIQEFKYTNIYVTIIFTMGITNLDHIGIKPFVPLSRRNIFFFF
jgi:hypothetical protein